MQTSSPNDSTFPGFEIKSRSHVSRSQVLYRTQVDETNVIQLRCHHAVAQATHRASLVREAGKVLQCDGFSLKVVKDGILGIHE